LTDFQNPFTSGEFRNLKGGGYNSGSFIHSFIYFCKNMPLTDRTGPKSDMAY